MSALFDRRLHIVVPYRDREPHLRVFVPHMRYYFARDKLDRNISYRVTFVEQERGLPFNRGALLNIGFLFGADACDYTCFHDIDYLPIWADYSWVDRPTGIVWFGAETRPIAAGRSRYLTRNKLDEFFGGALLVPNALFKRVNGCSNDYWGWGYEDMDLVRRFEVEGIHCDRRKGTFWPLDHDSNGFDLSGAFTPAATGNRALFLKRWSSNLANDVDGLSTVSYEMLARETIADPTPERDAAYEKIVIRLKRHGNNGNCNPA